MYYSILYELVSRNHACMKHLSLLMKETVLHTKTLTNERTYWLTIMTSYTIHILEYVIHSTMVLMNVAWIPMHDVLCKYTLSHARLEWSHCRIYPSIYLLFCRLTYKQSVIDWHQDHTCQQIFSFLRMHMHVDYKVVLWYLHPCRHGNTYI